MAGNLPFDEPNLPVLFKKIARAEYSIPAWFTPEMTSLLKAMLNPSVKKRYALRRYQECKCQMLSLNAGVLLSASVTGMCGFAA